MRVIKSGIIKNVGSSGQIDDQWVFYSSCYALYHNNRVWLYCDAMPDNLHPRVELLSSKDGENFVNKGIVVPLGSVGSASSYGVGYRCLSINRFNNQFFLYTSTWDGASRGGVNLYISKDGMNFVDKSTVFQVSGIGLVDDVTADGVKFVSLGNKMFGYYEGDNNNYLYANILGIVSDDGMNFVKKGIYIPKMSAGKIADVSVAYWGFSPFRWHNKIWMLFSACPGAGISGILALYCSDDGCNFEARGEIIVPRGGAGEVDTVTNAAGQCVLPIDGTHIAIYSGCTGASGSTRGMRTILEL